MDRRKPSEVTDDYFLYCHEDRIRSQYPDANGKWMMFFEKGDVLDEKWAKACELYRQGKLIGIASMKVSTARSNPRASDDSTGVMIFYCGPANEEAAVMKYGQILLQEFPYATERGFIYYKSDEQTEAGTRATGRKKNSLYRLAVPTKEDTTARREGQRIHTNSNLIPTAVNDGYWLLCEDEKISTRYPQADGKWMMFFKQQVLDEKWAEACKLYSQGRLTGIASIKVSTSRSNRAGAAAADTGGDSGVMLFYCGPADDEEAVMDYGEMLLEEFPYEADCGFMYYKSHEQSQSGTRATGQTRNSRYRIPVPSNSVVEEGDEIAASNCGGGGFRTAVKTKRKSAEFAAGGDAAVATEFSKGKKQKE